MLNIDINNQKLTEKDKDELKQILAMQNPKISDDLKQIWYLMDKIWDEMECDNKKLNWNKIGKYYSHPIWLLNGLFIEQHALSMHIRKIIASYIVKQNFKRICDWGGGFGTLAREIALLDPNLMIDIYEPYPSEYGKKCIQDFPNIKFINKIQNNFYDCLVTTDVLEHLDNPLDGLSNIYNALQENGTALIGHCFYPVIKCHLPKNFHYRYTFNYFASKIGFKKIKILENSEYITIFQKKQKTTSSELQFQKKLSQILFSLILRIKVLHSFYKKIKLSFFKKVIKT